jgi:Transposase DDE domain
MAAQKKAVYRVTNWKAYNESLVRRGDITLWFEEDVIAAWAHANQAVKVGRPFTYSDTAIECLLALRELFQLPYRQTEGLGRALVKLMNVEVAIPDFTSLAKRAAKLGVTLELPSRPGPIDVVIDSTGLKIFGAGEWRSEAYRTPKRRTWRKLHLSINAATQEIVAEVLTSKRCGDADLVPELLAQIAPPVAKLYGDGAYDKWKLYHLLEREKIQPVIPPRRRASIQRHGNCAGLPLPRDEAIRGIRRLGRQRWKQQIGYHRRSLVETSMSRLKRAFGTRLKNKRFENQQTEARLRCKILNHFTQLGLPKFVWN